MSACRMGVELDGHNPRASILTQDDEAIILAYRWRTRLPLDDCLDRLRRLMPKLSRSALYRCLRRRGLGRIGSTASSPPLTSVGLKGPYRFEITAIEIVFRYVVLGAGFTVLLAVEEVTKHLYAEVAEPALESDVRRRHGRGQSPSLRGGLPRQ